MNAHNPFQNLFILHNMNKKRNKTGNVNICVLLQELFIAKQNLLYTFNRILSLTKL